MILLITMQGFGLDLKHINLVLSLLICCMKDKEWIKIWFSLWVIVSVIIIIYCYVYIDIYDTAHSARLIKTMTMIDGTRVLQRIFTNTITIVQILLWTTRFYILLNT